MDNLLYENDKKVNVRVLHRAWGGERPGYLHGEGNSLVPSSMGVHEMGVHGWRKLPVINWSFATQVKAKHSRCLKTWFVFS